MSEISIPREVLLLHKLAEREKDAGTPGMARMRLFFDKATGRAQVSNGRVAAEATWTDAEYGLDGKAQVSVTKDEGKFLSALAGSDEVLYDADTQQFTSGRFTLPASKPAQQDFKFMDDTFEGVHHGLTPKGTKGIRFSGKDMKLLVDTLSKLGVDVPFTFYGDKTPVTLEVEKGEIGFRFIMVPVSS